MQKPDQNKVLPSTSTVKKALVRNRDVIKGEARATILKLLNDGETREALDLLFTSITIGRLRAGMYVM